MLAMLVHQCDMCGGKLGEPIRIEVRQIWRTIELCNTCALPVLGFLVQESFIELRELQDLQTEEQAV